MPRPRLPLVLSLLICAAAPAAEPKFKKHDINPKSPFEAAGVFDVDNDGKLDVVSGDTWYHAPDWTPYKVRDVVKVGTYYNDFAALPIDVNGDGKMDFVTCSYFGQDVGWVENPGTKGKPWTYHAIDKPGNSEAAAFVDLTGDGVPEVLPNTVNVVVWYELQGEGSQAAWKKHDFGKTGAGHGVGSGDVNGDGRTDILTPHGWYEAPDQPRAGEWTWHPEWNLGAAGIQILVKDLDGDGLADVVWGMGHDYGLNWMKQARSDGKRTWGKHVEIDKTISEYHTLLWADLDGDGKANELVTGKRVYAHEVENGATDGSFVGWYTYDNASGQWSKHTIFQGEPAQDAPKDAGKRDALKDFPPGTAGTGLQMTAIDIDKDGDIDLVCPGKSGLYWFENLGTGQ